MKLLHEIFAIRVIEIWRIRQQLSKMQTELRTELRAGEPKSLLERHVLSEKQEARRRLRKELRAQLSAACAALAEV